MGGERGGPWKVGGVGNSVGGGRGHSVGGERGGALSWKGEGDEWGTPLEMGVRGRELHGQWEGHGIP